MNENSLATEMLRELRQNNKRLFIVVVILVLLWFATIIGFTYYINQYEIVSDDTYISAENGDNNENTKIDISDITNG